MTTVEIIKTAYNYYDKHPKEYIVAQARKEDMSFISFIAWELQKMGISKTDALKIASYVWERCESTSLF